MMNQNRPINSGNFEKGNQVAKGKGRKPGVPNKFTRELKDMILGALAENGGQAYLAEQARENPNAFMTLLGKVLPMTVATPEGSSGKLVIKWES